MTITFRSYLSMARVSLSLESFGIGDCFVIKVKLLSAVDVAKAHVAL
jgi:hypothetical protein